MVMYQYTGFKTLHAHMLYSMIGKGHCEVLLIHNNFNDDNMT